MSDSTTTGEAVAKWGLIAVLAYLAYEWLTSSGPGASLPGVAAGCAEAEDEGGGGEEEGGEGQGDSLIDDLSQAGQDLEQGVESIFQGEG